MEYKYKYITEAVIAKHKAIKERIDAALVLDPNRAPDEWATSNRTGQDNLLDFIGLGPEVGGGEAWKHLTSLIRKVWKGESIVLPPVSGMTPIFTPQDEVASVAAAQTQAVPLDESNLGVTFSSLEDAMPKPAAATSFPDQPFVQDVSSPDGKTASLDAEKPETWESLLDDWIQEEFSHLFGGMLEGHPAEDLTEWVLEMLEKVSKLGEDEKVKIDHLKLFFSSVSGDVLRPFLTKHIAALMQEHKVGYSAAEVARWRNEFFDYFAKIIRYSAQGQNGVIPGLANDPERLTQEAMIVMKDWEKHVGKPEAREIYAELAEYWAANADQFEKQLKAVFEKLVTAQRL